MNKINNVVFKYAKEKMAVALIIACIFLMSIFSFNLVGAVSPVPDPEPPSREVVDWTIMYYFAAENKMSGVAKSFLQNLTKVGSTEELNIAALYDGSKFGDTKLFYVKYGELEDLSKKFGWPNEVDTGDSNTLRLFCKTMMKEYPARHYGLMIVSIAVGGWQGICPDYQTYPKYSVITMPKLSNVLREITNNSEKQLDVVSIDACLAGMIEVAHEVAPYAKYFVASEADNVLVQIWPAIGAIWDLKNHTDLSTEEFVRSIINYYTPQDVSLSPSRLSNFFNRLPFPSLHIVTIHTMLSAINLSKINDLEEAVDNISSILLLNQRDETCKKTISIARSKVMEYGKDSPKYHILYHIKYLPIELFVYDCYIDLYNFAQTLYNETENQVIKTACTKIMQCIQNSVILRKTTTADDRSYGLSIYFPSAKYLYNHCIMPRKIPIPYEKIQFSKDNLWDEFLRAYLKV